MKLGNDIARTRCSGFKLSKSILILFATIFVFVAFFVPSSTQAEEPCDTTKVIGNFTLVFDTVIYNGSLSSEWVYKLTWDGTPPGLSHFMIELCTLITNANLIAVEPASGSIGPDGSTGLYGIKWDDIENFPANTPVVFSFKLDDSLKVDHTQFAPKAGINSNIATICGPTLENCDTVGCDVNSPPEVSCPPNDTFWVCLLDTTICVDGFTYSDPDNNVESVAVTIEDSTYTLSGDTICFMPVSGDNVIILTVTDSCGETATCTTTIVVLIDTIPPDVTCPDSVTVQCIGDVPTPDISLVTATDSCDPNPEIMFVSDSSDGQTCPETITRTYKATDACGNVGFCTQIITVNDTIAPVCSNPPNDTTVQCAGDVPAPDTLLVSATDNCDPNPVIMFVSDSSDGQTCPETITRTYKATDSCGNVGFCTQIITVNDTIPPMLIGCPSDTTILWGQTVPDPANVTATDNCDDSVEVVPSEETISGACVDTIVRIWIAIDSCDNADTCMQTIVVVNDTIPPDVTCPASITVQCIADVPAPDISLVTATDSCDPNPEIMFVSDSSDGQTCPETIFRTYKATDDCENVGFCTQIITVNDTIAPVCSNPPNDTTVQCAGDVPAPDTSLVSATDNCDPNPVIMFVSDSSDGQTCPETITRTYKATDSCGNVGFCTQIITVNDTIPPMLIGCPSDTTILWGQTVPDPANVTATDNCDDSVDVVPSEETIPAACFNTIVRKWVAIDSCGNKDSCMQTIVVVIDTIPPVVTCPDSVTVQCPGDVPTPDISLVTATDSCDPNPEIMFVSDSSDGQTCPETITRTYKATDDCGNVGFCTQIITVNDTIPPVLVGCPNNTTVSCNEALPAIANVTATDNCDTLVDITFTQDSVGGNCPQEYVITRKWVATDDCENSDSCMQTITVVDTTAPVCSVPDETTITSCDPQRICLPVSATDNCDPNPSLIMISGDGTYSNGQWCYDADIGLVTLQAIFKSTDACGNYCYDTLKVTIDIDPTLCDPGDCAVISIEKTHETPQGQYEEVAVTIDVLPFEIGGLDLLIEYDASALSLSSVATGSFIINCGWEYYTYRNGAAGNCGSNACPSGKVRIISVAETNNGANHPTCFQGAPAEIARLIFLVTNDRTLECQYVPVRFCWYDCGDNTLSSKTGEDIYISDSVFNYYDGVIWNEITDISAEFPSLFGANYTCDVDLGDGKPDPIRSICFYNGGIDIVCADSIDDRGDINLNGVPNEVADAVLLGNYFIYGLAVFTINLEGQIAASDVNADGTVLSVADLVYLVRIVLGDALPYSKVVASVNIDFYHYSDGRLAVGEKTAIGAAYVVAEGDVTPILLATEMDMKYHFDGTNTRVLVWSESGSGFTGDFMQIDADLISFELATAEGQPVSLNTLPTAFELLQNYPNPFNPSTVISFTLPNASEYSLTIYNLSGQVVKEFNGKANSAGTIELEWQAVDVASGVYFYRLEANSGRYVETKKMILLK